MSVTAHEYGHPPHRTASWAVAKGLPQGLVGFALTRFVTICSNAKLTQTLISPAVTLRQTEESRILVTAATFRLAAQHMADMGKPLSKGASRVPWHPRSPQTTSACRPRSLSRHPKLTDYLRPA